MPAAAALRDHDPDLHDALHRARPIAAQLRQARERLVSMGPAPTLHAAAAQKGLIADLAADLRLIGERAQIDGATLEYILECDHVLYMRYRRRPSLEQLAASVAAGAEAAVRHAHEAHRAVTDAQQAVEVATRRATAASAALTALSG